MKINQLKAGVILSYMTLIIKNLILIIYTPVMLRILGQSEYGLYQMAYSFISYLGLLSFGFGSTYIRFYSRYKNNNDKEEIAKLNGLYLLVFIILSIITLILGVILVGNVDLIFSNKLTEVELAKTKILMMILVVNMVFIYINSVFQSNVTAHECFFYQRLLNLITELLTPFLTLPLLLLGFQSVAIVVITTVLNLAKLLSNVRYCSKNFKLYFNFKNPNFTLFKEIWTFSFYIFLNMIVDTVNWSVDKYILGAVRGTSAVAIYSVGGQINLFFQNISGTISTVFIPRVNKLTFQEDGDKNLSDLFIKVGRIQFVILLYILSGFFILGKYFIMVWAGTEYSNSYFVALILMSAVMIPITQNLAVEIQKAKNLHKFRSVLYFAIAIGNLGISIPLAKQYGEIGSAIGTAIALILGNIIIMNFYNEKIVKLDMYEYWKNIIKIFLFALIPLLIVLVFTRNIAINSLYIFFVIGFLYTILYAIIAWFFILNLDEKKLIMEPIRKISKKFK